VPLKKNSFWTATCIKFIYAWNSQIQDFLLYQPISTSPINFQLLCKNWVEGQSATWSSDNYDHLIAKRTVIINIHCHIVTYPQRKKIYMLKYIIHFGNTRFRKIPYKLTWYKVCVSKKKLSNKIIHVNLMSYVIDITVFIINLLQTDVTVHVILIVSN
jgi:hypothetical protein